MYTKINMDFYSVCIFIVERSVNTWIGYSYLWKAETIGSRAVADVLSS